jgi:hypothetical protein
MMELIVASLEDAAPVTKVFRLAGSRLCNQAFTPITGL